MLKRAYIEITDICNLSCSFCPGTKREKLFMTPEAFRTIAEKIRPYTGYLYFHVMGEPLLHPQLAEILGCAAGLGYRLNITTNGLLIKKNMQLLLSTAALRKVSISLHSFEGNHFEDTPGFTDRLTRYLDDVWGFCEKAECIVALRLWNEGGESELNPAIMSFLSEKTGLDVPSLPYDANGRRLGRKIYLESADKFDWPINTVEKREVRFCHGLSEQIAVLCDGTVVPCCLDSEGSIPLGNLLTDDIDAILDSPRAKRLLDSFKKHRPAEELCRHCGYAERFS